MSQQLSQLIWKVWGLTGMVTEIIFTEVEKGRYVKKLKGHPDIKKAF